MTTEIPITLLFDPSSSLNGKFYIAAEHQKSYFALYGANTSGNRGNKTNKSSLAELQKLLRTKKSKGYRDADESEISNAAKTHLIEIVSAELNIKNNKNYTFITRSNQTYLVFGEDGGTATSNSAQAKKPKISKINYKVWL